jgi:hypothetical protein
MQTLKRPYVQAVSVFFHCFTSLICEEAQSIEKWGQMCYNGRSEKLLTLVVPLLSVVSWKTFPKASKRDEMAENLPEKCGLRLPTHLCSFREGQQLKGVTTLTSKGTLGQQ